MSMFEEADVLIWVDFSSAPQCRDQLCIWSQNPLPASNQEQASMSVLSRCLLMLAYLDHTAEWKDTAVMPLSRLRIHR